MYSILYQKECIRDAFNDIYMFIEFRMVTDIPGTTDATFGKNISHHKLYT